MNHTEIRRKLSAYLDNAVSKGEKVQIEAHLAECGNCRGALADLERTVGHLKSLPEVEPPPWLADKIMAHVRESAVPKPSLWRRLFLPLQVKLPIEALAIVFVCVTGYYLARMNAQEPLTPPVPATSEEATLPAPAPQKQRPAPAPSKVPPSTPRAVASPQTVPQQKEGPTAYAPPPVSAPAPPAAPPAMAPTTVPSLPAYDARETDEWVEARRKAEWQARRATDNASRQMMQKRGMSDEPRYSTQASGGSSNEGASREVWAERPGREPQEDWATRWNQPEQQEGVKVTLRVSDPAGAVGSIEQAVTRSGGAIVRRDYGEAGHLLFVRIEAHKVAQLMGRLGRIGTLREQPHASALEEGMVDLSIRW